MKHELTKRLRAPSPGPADLVSAKIHSILGWGEGGCKTNPDASVPAEAAALVAARKGLQPVLDQLAALEAALVPYEQIKQQLAEAGARYRTLTDEFVNELKSRCGAMNDGSGNCGNTCTTKLYGGLK